MNFLITATPLALLKCDTMDKSTICPLTVVYNFLKQAALCQSLIYDADL